MKIEKDNYNRFSIVKEMFDTINVIENFDWDESMPIAQATKKCGRLFLSGEGSSRIFPAKNAVYKAKKRGITQNICTAGGREAQEYDLSQYVVVAGSNSGKTRETLSLMKKLSQNGCDGLYGLCAYSDAPMTELGNKCYVLNCGKEEAVGTTKSVVEQALFFHSIIENIMPTGIGKKTALLAQRFEETLSAKLDPSIIETVLNASMVYFAGRNNGVAEELTLKANEISRKKSAFLEGTYVFHGIEEVMTPDEVVVLIDPSEKDFEKFEDVLRKGVGMSVVAISAYPTPFPTISIPDIDGLNEYIQLAAGWTLLVEIGIALGIDIDKPVRARKIGNMMTG